MTWPCLMNLPSHTVLPAGALYVIEFFIISMWKYILFQKFEPIVCNYNNSAFNCLFLFPPSPFPVFCPAICTP